MSRFARLAGVPFLALAVFVGASACSRQESAEKAKSAPEAPVTAGYESAIAAHAMKPIFRPNGSAPAVYGPGDIYNFLATGEETNNSFFQFEAIVPTGGGPPPHIHSREDESFYVVSGSLEIGSTIRLIRPRPVFRLHSPRDRPPIQKCGPRHGHSVGRAEVWVGVSGGPRGREEVRTRLTRARSRREEMIE
jgi:hypothetical protein